jgi:lipoyl(octanoyl) transferase
MRDSPLQLMDIGRCRYAEALALQERLVEERRVGTRPDTLVLVEHEPVYTLGRTADEEHILLSKEALTRQGIDVVRIGRGGDVTYHGPGQLVGYPIIDLKALGRGVLWHVNMLEKTIQATLADFGIDSRCEREHRGVWVGDEKVSAVGVRVTRGITMHGFALNVSVDLNYFTGIVPCGIQDRGVTSMDQLVSGVEMDAVKASVVRHVNAAVGAVVER